jgi:hypothetical protein
MKTQELVIENTKKQKIQLVKGEFTPSEALDIIRSLIDEKINFHKIQRLQLWEGSHSCNTDQLDGRIQELEKEKQVAKEFIAGMRAQGKKLSINGVLEIKIAE